MASIKTCGGKIIVGGNSAPGPPFYPCNSCCGPPCDPSLPSSVNVAFDIYFFPGIPNTCATSTYICSVSGILTQASTVVGCQYAAALTPVLPCTTPPIAPTYNVSITVNCAGKWTGGAFNLVWTSPTLMGAYLATEAPGYPGYPSCGGDPYGSGIVPGYGSGYLVILNFVIS